MGQLKPSSATSIVIESLPARSSYDDLHPIGDNLALVLDTAPSIHADGLDAVVLVLLDLHRDLLGQLSG